ncbi:hypothetical protein L6Q21_09675 [Sandaracinobacter sp. RS1-74]|uniref:hypothetical protein n=1 Tax=Sandaracinobacteroides sayramensis TaxID=2913411 RepID=UPI001EDC09D0|nr:hypothetical protein [Sandaracinobacteroides sayramensis]MCG2841248.1 hypothetical protein [Sandaracinobacteroides sayramensis]
MTIQRKVLVVMRSSHLHTELVEVTARINVIGDAMQPRVEGDLPAIEELARRSMRRIISETDKGFGPWDDAEDAFDMDFVVCAPFEIAGSRGRIVLVEQVATETALAWSKGRSEKEAA